MKKDLLKTSLLMSAIVLVTVGAALLLNLLTGPKIAADQAYREELAAQQAAGVLLEVFPGATGFEEITSTLEIDPASGVTAVHKETSGKGYVFVASKTNSPMKDVVIVTAGVSEGKVTGVSVSFANENDYVVSDATLNSFVGLDSTLDGVEITSKATVSSNTIKEAVSSGMIVLAANGLMEAAAKTAEQVYDELLLTVFPGFVIGKKSELTGTATITKALKGNNGSGVVCHVVTGNTTVLAIYNVSGNVQVYEPELVDEATQTYTLKEVTASYEAVVTEVKTFAAAHVTAQDSLLASKITSLYPTATITSVEITTFGDLMAAASFEVDGVTYYGFYARPNNAYKNQYMDIYVIITADGKIAKVDVAEIFINGGYFADKYPEIKDFVVEDYLDQFVEVEGDAIIDNAFAVGGDFHITKATLSSYGVRDALKCSFELYNALQGGNN